MTKLKNSFRALIHILGEPFRQVSLARVGKAFLILVVIIVLLLLLCRCSTKRHVVTDTEQRSLTTTTHTGLSQLQSIDSLLQTLSLSADSIVIVISPPNGDSLSPAVRLTAHQPKAQVTSKGSSSVVQVTQEKDTSTTALNTSTHTDTNKEVVGVATPMNGTIVVIIISIAVLFILAIFLWLILKKYRIL